VLVAAAAPQREDCASNQARATEQLAWRHACEEGGACTPGPSPPCPQRLCRSCAQAALDFLGARKMPEIGRPEPSGGPSATKNAKHYNPMKEKTRQLLQVGWGRAPCLCAEPGHTVAWQGIRSCHILSHGRNSTGPTTSASRTSWATTCAGCGDTS